MESMPSKAPSEADFLRAVPHDFMTVCAYLLVSLMSQHCKFILGVMMFFCGSPIIIILIAVLFLE